MAAFVKQSLSIFTSNFTCWQHLPLGLNLVVIKGTKIQVLTLFLVWFQSTRDLGAHEGLPVIEYLPGLILWNRILTKGTC